MEIKFERIKLIVFSEYEEAKEDYNRYTDINEHIQGFNEGYLEAFKFMKRFIEAVDKEGK